MLPRTLFSTARAAVLGDPADQRPDDPRIIPLRPRPERAAHPAPAYADTPRLPAAITRFAVIEDDGPDPDICEEAPATVGLRYLAWMLPAIPVAAFVLTFLACYLLMGLALPTDAVRPHLLGNIPVLDPALPLLAAVLLGTLIAVLCAVIYWGYARVIGELG